MVTTIAPGTAQSHDLDVLHRAVQELEPQSPVRELLNTLAQTLGRGVGLALLEQDRELTPNEAAALLSMSRPHLLSFMDAGALEFTRVGTHRRIRMSDLLDFDARRKHASKVVAETTARSAAAQELHLDEVAPISDEAMAELDQL